MMVVRLGILSNERQGPGLSRLLSRRLRHRDRWILDHGRFVPACCQGGDVKQVINRCPIAWELGDAVTQTDPCVLLGSYFVKERTDFELSLRPKSNSVALTFTLHQVNKLIPGDSTQHTAATERLAQSGRYTSEHAIASLVTV